MLLPKVLRRRRTEARKTTPKRNLMKLFKRLSQLCCESERGVNQNATAKPVRATVRGDSGVKPKL